MLYQVSDHHQGSINEHIYGILVKLYGTLDDAILRNRVLQCLGELDRILALLMTHFRTGFLFRAYPTLMTHESSAELMDQIFSSNDEEAKGRLLRILQDFLSSESAKHAAQEKGTLSVLLPSPS
jgi:cohesin loading factor subunit SCC2